ncbi:MAG: aldo/keto reductase [Oscillospiraceae bacterium]|nr:aldo/keto reductase [Oscillospiraceae bacterium]
MEYRMLGNTGLRASVIGMGCEGFAEDGCAMTEKLFDAAERLGINYFDLYASDPDMRRAVGRAMKGRREKFLIQSHICSVWKNGQYLRTRKLDEVKAGFEEMMDLLDTDYLDVGMLHYCDAMSDWESIVQNGILDYARELKARGRIRHIGLSSHNPLVAERAVNEAEIEVLMFSVNPCYDLQPANEDVEEIWADKNYRQHLTNMDPDRQRLYETCQRKGVGVTVMKAFAGGELLGSNQIAGVSLTVNQCIAYALSRPAVSVILAGAHSVEQLEQSAAYCTAPPEERDYASALASFPRVSWEGHCMYCSHCEPCPKFIDIASVTKFLHLAQAQGKLPETVREHYAALEHHAGDCVQCGACETRCPFGVAIRENMRAASGLFGY